MTELLWWYTKYLRNKCTLINLRSCFAFDCCMQNYHVHWLFFTYPFVHYVLYCRWQPSICLSFSIVEFVSWKRINLLYNVYDRRYQKSEQIGNNIIILRMRSKTILWRGLLLGFKIHKLLLSFVNSQFAELDTCLELTCIKIHL